MNLDNNGLENTNIQGCKRKLKLDSKPEPELKFNNILKVAEHELQILENNSQSETSVPLPQNEYIFLQCYNL